MDAAKSAKATFKLNADLQVTKIDSLDPVAVGQTLTYTATVANLGPTATCAVKVTDTLPSSLTYLGASATQGTVTTATTSITAAPTDAPRTWRQSSTNRTSSSISARPP